MRVAFRVDASTQIGSGHVTRCLALASYLEARGAECLFVCCKQPGDLISYIKSKGKKVISICGDEHATDGIFDIEIDIQNTVSVVEENKTDIVIVDHYQIAKKWESGVKRFCQKVVAIDDLANRDHDVDILIDQNLYKDPGLRYQGRVPLHCKLLLGPKYALLRNEFTELARSNMVPRGPLRRVLVFYGGMDIVNETTKALVALEHHSFNSLTIDIVLGTNNPHKEHILQAYRHRKNWNFHVQTDNMAELMKKADLMLCAGGSIQWERIYMVLPAIAIAVADNQREACEHLSTTGLATYLGYYGNVTEKDIHATVLQWQEIDLSTWQYSYKRLIQQPIGNTGFVADTILA